MSLFTNSFSTTWNTQNPSKQKTDPRTRLLVGALPLPGLNGMSGTQVTRKIIEHIRH